MMPKRVPTATYRDSLRQYCCFFKTTTQKVPMDKYVVTELTPYLVIDAQHVPYPRPLDDEEDIEIVRGVTADQILQMIREGDFNLVGGWGALLALEKLRELGEIV